MRNIIPIIIFVSVLLFSGSCKPQQDDAIELNPVLSNVTFEITEVATETNTYILTNTTSGGFLYHWDLGNNLSETGEEAKVYFQFKGDYEVTLKVFNDGGFAETSKTITVLEDDPTPCAPESLMEFLSNCDQLAWKLLPDAGAYWVGPADGSGTTWWASSADDVDTRFCAFDDEWIFNIAGEMIYDTKGDLWAEDYMGFSFECVTDDQLGPDVAAWASGTHSFVAIDNGADEQIQLEGLGAFMGLPKAANGMEVTMPVDGIIYDVIDRGEDADGKFMELEVNYSAGIWRFKFVAQ